MAPTRTLTPTFERNPDDRALLLANGRMFDTRGPVETSRFLATLDDTRCTDCGEIVLTPTGRCWACDEAREQ